MTGNIIGKTGRAHLGNGFAAGGDDQALHLQCATRCGNRETASIMNDIADGRIEPQLCARLRHIRRQHGDDVLCRIIAEKLTQRLFVPGDAVG